MKKTIITIIIIAIIGVIAWFGYSKYQDNILGRGADSSFNQMGDVTSFATTTGSYCSNCPVKLLHLDANRRYAIIQNLSDTDIYLYATTTDLGIGLTGTYLDPIDNSSGPTKTATGTQMGIVGAIQFTGILLEANGQPLSQIELGPENMVYGHIWATSSAASKQIQVNYK